MKLMSPDPKFKTEEDSRQKNRLLGLAYGSYLPFVFLTQTLLSPLEYALKFVVVSAISILPDFLLGTPGKGFLSERFNQASLFKDARPAPQEIVDDVEELRLKAGLPEKIDCYLSEEADKYAASTYRNHIYVGAKFFKKMDRAEMNTILAHEVAHIKTGDTADQVLFKPASLNAVADVLISATTLVAGAESAGLKGIVAPLLSLLAACAFHEFQDALKKASSRAQEYRADRNAFKLTGDFKNAARAFVKMRPDHCYEPPRISQLFSTHPRGIERLRALEREANGGRETHVCNALFKLASEAPVDARKASNPEILVDLAWILTDGGQKKADMKLVSFGSRPDIN